jgi:LysR family hydrogen peroxide-inducible transcriptional activator
MTIVQLEYLLAVANHGNFSLAAQHCFVTQPTLSMQIKNLEEELGIVLFDRTKQPVMPTDAGLVVIEHARRAIGEFNRVREALDEMEGEVAGTLVLGVIPTVAPYMLPRLVAEFRARYPQVNLEVREMQTAAIVAALGRDALDCAIVSAGTCPDSLSEQELFNDKFFAYVSPRNRLFERTNIRIEDIDMHELLLAGEGNCLRDQVVELCSGRPSSAVPVESNSLETLMRIVDNTALMTIIPEMAVEFVPEERRGQVIPLAKGATSRKIILATRRTYVKSSIVDALKETITIFAR